MWENQISEENEEKEEEEKEKDREMDDLDFKAP